MERITGPFQNHYIAAYTVKCDGFFVGYAKIFSTPVTDVWEGHAMLKVSTVTEYPDKLSALSAAEEYGRFMITGLGLRGWGEAPWPTLQVRGSDTQAK